jgi:hypothetical protein
LSDDVSDGPHALLADLHRGFFVLRGWRLSMTLRRPLGAALSCAALVASGCARSVIPVDTEMSAPDAMILDASPDAALPDGANVDAEVPDAASDVADVRRCESCQGAPRPVAPLSTTTVTTNRPTLRWELPRDGDGARVEVCRDRDCNERLLSQTQTGDHVTLTESLTAGVFFWRVQSATDGVAAGPFSPTWEFRCFGRATPVDSAWGSFLDVNGDGLADLAFVEGGRVRIIYGNRSRSLIARTVPEPAWSPNELIPAGDLDGDGFGDLIVSASISGFPAIEVGCYRGTREGIVAEPTIVQPRGTRALAAGDLDGDGYGDIVLPHAACCCSSTSRGGISVAFGPLSAEGLARRVEIPEPADSAAHDGCFGQKGAAPGDMDGDGFADFLIASPMYGSRDSGHLDWHGSGRVYLIRGAPGSVDPEPHIVEYEVPNDQGNFGRVMGAAGDLNGDGYPDAFVSWRLLAGARTSPTIDPIFEVYSGEPTVVGDADGDGRVDFVSVSAGAERYSIDLDLHYGGDSSDDLSQRCVVESVAVGIPLNGGISARDIGGADLDGDGLGDVVAFTHTNDPLNPTSISGWFSRGRETACRPADVTWPGSYSGNLSIAIGP